MTAGQRVRAYLQLVRLPAVFTAMADVVLGFVLAHRTLSPISEFSALLGASTALYLAGMVMNDFFDRAVDREERPNRPIPSGRVPSAAALTLGMALLLAGLCAASAATRTAFLFAAGLAVLILAYDGVLKSTFAGPVAMGACRLVNVLLGASALPLSGWASPQVGPALAMGIYVAGITWFSRGEAGMSPRKQLVGATIVIHSGIAFVVFLLLSPGMRSEVSAQAAVVLLPIAAFINLRVARALRQPTPANVQAAVKRLLLAIVLLDATMIYGATGNLALACGTALLIVPATTLGRWIFIT